MVVFAIIMFLGGLMVTVAVKAIQGAHRVRTSSRLQQIYMATGLFAEDTDGNFPAEGNKKVKDPATSPAWFYRLPPYVQADSVRGKNSVFQCSAFTWSHPEHFDHASPKSLKMNSYLDDKGRPSVYRPGSIPDESLVIYFASAVGGETGMGQWGHLVESGIDDQRLGVAMFLFLDGHIEQHRRPASGSWKEVVRFTSARW